MAKQKYPLPQIVVNMWIEYQSLLNLRDLYVARPFGCGYKKAKKAALEAQQLLGKSSRIILELYPELDKSKTWTIQDLKFEPYVEVIDD